ncbi:hypothetical protein [Porphyromonas pogonae]|uniref:hypothetical protein n=1 Tax=Porphyromonas pogonae TaxID=867595 RepID=UPI002E771542|nr:hypothetical protein [Porphyromonas pogonae]
MKNRCHFLLDAQKGYDALKIRYRIRYNNNVIGLGVGYRAEPAKWSKETERCIKGTTHGKDKIPASEINKALQQTEYAVSITFNYFDSIDVIPTPEEFKSKYYEIIGKELIPNQDSINFWKLWDEYIKTESVLRSWSDRHLKNHNTAKRHIEKYDRIPQISKMDRKWGTGLIYFMSNTLWLKKRNNRQNT